MKNAQVCCYCRRWIHSCAATLPFRATQARNTSRAKRNPECTIWSLNTSVFTLSLVWDWRSDPHLLLGVFPPWHVRWGNFKPQQISQTGIFTSPLYNPKTPHCLKNHCVHVCDRSKSSPNSKSVQPAAQHKHTTMKGRPPSNQHGAWAMIGHAALWPFRWITQRRLNMSLNSNGKHLRSCKEKC